MTVNDLLQLARNNLLNLQRSRASAWESGQAQAVSAIDADIVATQETITSLETLLPE